MLSMCVASLMGLWVQMQQKAKAMHISHTVPISRVDFSCHHCVYQTLHAAASEADFYQ